jgi:hypothetical protein
MKKSRQAGRSKKNSKSKILFVCFPFESLSLSSSLFYSLVGLILITNARARLREREREREREKERREERDSSEKRGEREF